MRGAIFALLASALAACTTAPQMNATRSAQAEAQLQRMLAGKTAGQPMNCLSSHRSGNMVIVDDNTVLFRASPNRVYRNDLGPGCSRLGSGYYSLMTRGSGGTGLCRGDIAQVVDLTSGITVGSCVVGDFVPYTRS